MSDERYYKNYPERETEQDEAPKPDAQYLSLIHISLPFM